MLKLRLGALWGGGTNMLDLILRMREMMIMEMSSSLFERLNRPLIVRHTAPPHAVCRLNLALSLVWTSEVKKQELAHFVVEPTFISSSSSIVLC